MNGFGGREEESDQDEESDDEGLEGLGWQLLNRVESGGTLSSLFTILSLFTEDVKLRYEEDELEQAGERNGDVADFDLNGHDHAEGTPAGLRRPSWPGTGGHRTGSETEDADDERGEIGAGGKGGKRRSFASAGASMNGGLSTETEDSTIAEEPEDLDEEDEGTTKTAKATPSFAKTSSTSTSTSYPFPQMNRKSSGARPGAFSHASGRREPPRKKRSAPAPAATSSKQFETTLARATVDTTLAVIPAEAFRRLTKKFPNAAA